MRQITEVLRLNAQSLSYRQIAQSVGISASTVQSYLERAQRAGLSWPLPDDVDDVVLEARLFTRTEEELRPGRPEPNWLEVHRDDDGHADMSSAFHYGQGRVPGRRQVRGDRHGRRIGHRTVPRCHVMASPTIDEHIACTELCGARR